MSIERGFFRKLKHLLRRLDIFDVLALGLIAVFLGLALALIITDSIHPLRLNANQEP